jgi:hypothetical protein
MRDFAKFFERSLTAALLPASRINARRYHAAGAYRGFASGAVAIRAKVDNNGWNARPAAAPMTGETLQWTWR